MPGSTAPGFGAQYVVAEAGQLLGHRVGQVERDGPPEPRRRCSRGTPRSPRYSEKPKLGSRVMIPGETRELPDQDRVRVRRRHLVLRPQPARRTRKRGPPMRRQARTHRPPRRSAIDGRQHNRKPPRAKSHPDAESTTPLPEMTALEGDRECNRGEPIIDKPGRRCCMPSDHAAQNPSPGLGRPACRGRAPLPRGRRGKAAAHL